MADALGALQLLWNKQNQDKANMEAGNQRAKSSFVNGLNALNNANKQYGSLFDLKKQGQIKQELASVFQNAKTPEEELKGIMAVGAKYGGFMGMDKQIQTYVNTLGKSLIKPASSASNATPDEIKSTADGIMNGNIPPDRKYYRDTLRVDAELAKQGFSMAAANSEWKATQRFLSSMNSEKQVRLRQAISSTTEALDGLSQLNNELSRSELAPLNKAQLSIRANTGDPLAVKYLGQINIIRDELAQVFMGGNSPTDKALDLARETLDKNWSPKQLQAAIDNVKTNLKYRVNAINTADVQGVSGEAGTRYAPANAKPDSEMPHPLGGNQMPQIGSLFNGQKVLKVRRIK